MTREEFMDMVYSELHSDGDNYRANRIIDAADEYVETEKALEQEDVLGKIRAEIMKLDDINPDYPMDRTIHISRNEVLQILDKYKAESEE